MTRALSDVVVFFLVPFVLYVVWLVARLQNPLAVDRWTRQVLVPLSLAGLGCVLGGLLLVGLTAPRYEGGYLPAHVENGRIVPGRMQ